MQRVGGDGSRFPRTGARRGRANTAKSQKTASSLVFENLTDRARAEESGVTIQIGLLDSLLAQATSQPSYEESGAVALFELLLPNGMKDQSNEQADLVLVLDEAAAAFPWEILAARTRDRIDPLSVKAGMLRQLKVDAIPRGAARRQRPECAGDRRHPDRYGVAICPNCQARNGRRRRWRNN